MLSKFVTNLLFLMYSQMDLRAVHTNGLVIHLYLSKHISIQYILIVVVSRKSNSKTDLKSFMTMLMICLEIHCWEHFTISLSVKLHIQISKMVYKQLLQWALKIRSLRISSEDKSHKKHNMEMKSQFLRYSGTTQVSQILMVKGSQI